MIYDDALRAVHEGTFGWLWQLEPARNQTLWRRRCRPQVAALTADLHDAMVIDGAFIDATRPMHQDLYRCAIDLIEAQRFRLPNRSVWLERPGASALMREQFGEVRLNLIGAAGQGLWRWPVLAKAQVSFGVSLVGPKSVGVSLTWNDLALAAIEEADRAALWAKYMREQASEMHAMARRLMCECFILVAVLATRGTEVEREAASYRIKRRVTGHLERRAFAINRIVIRPDAPPVPRGAKAGYRMPLHWVRGHWWGRNRAEPKWVEPYWRGDPALGLRRGRYAVAPPGGQHGLPGVLPGQDGGPHPLQMLPHVGGVAPQAALRDRHALPMQFP